MRRAEISDEVRGAVGRVLGKVSPRRQEAYELFLAWNARDLHKWHHYFEVYERHLGRFVGRELTLLEVGIDRGGSLRFWRRYFGSRAHIAGIDIDPSCTAYAGDGIAVLIGDQADPLFLESVERAAGPFDVVIDDGGHTSRQQITTFETLYPRMRENGVFIVEDTHTSYWPRFSDREDGLTFIERAKQLVDTLHEWHSDEASFTIYGRPPESRELPAEVSDFCRNTRSISFYDSMVVFERGPNAERWHQAR